MLTVLLLSTLAIVVVICILCVLSPVFQYYTKLTLYYGLLSCTALVVLVLSIPNPNHVDNFRFMKLTFRLLRWLMGVEIELIGAENFEPWSGTYIVVSNHQATLDFLAISKEIPDRCTFIAKKELLYAGPFGLALWMCGTIFIDRLNHQNALGTMVHTANLISKQKTKVWIFPEGRRSPRQGMLPFKRGAFHLAVKAQVPIIPVVFAHYDFFDSKAKRLVKGKISMHVLPPVPTVDLSSDDVNDLADSIRDSMMKVYIEKSPSLHKLK